MMQPQCVMSLLYDCRHMINVCKGPTKYLRATLAISGKGSEPQQSLLVRQHTNGVLDRAFFSLCT